MHIVDTRDSNRSSAIILKGFINHHANVCPNDACPIKAYKKLMMKEKLTAENERKRKASLAKANSQNENSALL
jgi:hypothetical protein